MPPHELSVVDARRRPILFVRTNLGNFFYLDGGQHGYRSGSGRGASPSKKGADPASSDTSTDISTTDSKSSSDIPSSLSSITSSSSDTTSLTRTDSSSVDASLLSTSIPSTSTSPSVLVSSTATSSNVHDSPSGDTRASLSQSHIDVGAVAGGVIGGVILIAALVIASIFLIRRRRRNHTAPSAEFLSGRAFMSSPLPFGSSRAESFNSTTLLRGGGPGHSSLNRIVSNDGNSAEAVQLPVFTPGNFAYPFPEKMNHAKAS